MNLNALKNNKVIENIKAYFDHTNSGTQIIALIMRDATLGKLVNITNAESNELEDIYTF